MLLAERLRELMHYDPETGVFTRLISTSQNTNVGDTPGGIGNHGYIQFGVEGVIYLAHRLAWLYTHGEFPGAYIDHIDRDKTNNILSNLREATNSQNQQNQRPKRASNKTGLLGVSYNVHARRYSAQIGVCGKKIHLGLFNTAQEAHEAYLIKKREVHAFCMI